MFVEVSSLCSRAVSFMLSVHRWACRRTVCCSACGIMTYLNLGFKFVTPGEPRKLLGHRGKKFDLKAFRRKVIYFICKLFVFWIEILHEKKDGESCFTKKSNLKSRLKIAIYNFELLSQLQNFCQISLSFKSLYQYMHDPAHSLSSLLTSNILLLYVY